MYRMTYTKHWHLYEHFGVCQYLNMQRLYLIIVFKFVKFDVVSLTDCVHRGKYHVDPTKRCVCNTPFTTFRSTTSVPMTAGFIGLGYFLQAACATVSHGWLLKVKREKQSLIICLMLIWLISCFLWWITMEYSVHTIQNMAIIDFCTWYDFFFQRGNVFFYHSKFYFCSCHLK